MAKILVVDDEPEARKAVVEIAHMGGHETVEAYDGPSCLDELKDHRPDAIVLDWMLPEMHGGEVLEIIRQDEDYAEFKDVVIIVISDFIDDRSILNIMTSGANDHVAKMDNLDAFRDLLLQTIRDELRNAGDSE